MFANQRERVTADEEEFYQRIKKDREAQSKAREEQRAHDAAQREAQAGIDLERYLTPRSVCLFTVSHSVFVQRGQREAQT
jgi:hypothetical protein